MGYHTDFDGAFTITPALKPEHRAYLAAFSETRRMRRDEKRLASLPDPLRLAVKLPLGREGEYYVGDEAARANLGQQHGPTVVDFNSPPAGVPGLWCQWAPSDDGTELTAEGEKFYDYVEWLRYLMERFLRPWGYRLTGEVEWHGEDSDDHGKMIAQGQKVIVRRGRIVYDQEEEE